MRKYRTNASSTIRIAYGIELAAGCSHFSETKTVAADVQKANKALKAQHEARLALQEPVLEARAELRFVEFSVDELIRSAANAAKIADRERRTRIFATGFPGGVTPVVRPVGRAQIKPTRELIERLENSALDGIDDYRTTWVPALKDALKALEAAVAKYEAAQVAYKAAFQKEVALREAHYEAVDKVMGFVKFTFPRNKAIQDLIFPVMTDIETDMSEKEPPAEEDAQDAQGG